MKTLCASVLAVSLMVQAIPASADWNKAAFESKTAEASLKAFGIEGVKQSSEILLTVPEIAENGAVVPVSVSTKLPGISSILILADKNPYPLIARFNLPEGAPGEAALRVKLGQTSKIRAVVISNGKAFFTEKDVKVTVGGCGG